MYLFLLSVIKYEYFCEISHVISIEKEYNSAQNEAFNLKITDFFFIKNSFVYKCEYSIS